MRHLSCFSDLVLIGTCLLMLTFSSSGCSAKSSFNDDLFLNRKPESQTRLQYFSNNEIITQCLDLIQSNLEQIQNLGFATAEKVLQKSDLNEINETSLSTLEKLSLSINSASSRNILKRISQLRGNNIDDFEIYQKLIPSKDQKKLVLALKAINEIKLSPISKEILSQCSSENQNKSLAQHCLYSLGKNLPTNLQQTFPNPLNPELLVSSKELLPSNLNILIKPLSLIKALGEGVYVTLDPTLPLVGASSKSLYTGNGYEEGLMKMANLKPDWQCVGNSHSWHLGVCFGPSTSQSIAEDTLNFSTQKYGIEGRAWARNAANPNHTHFQISVQKKINPKTNWIAVRWAGKIPESQDITCISNCVTEKSNFIEDKTKWKIFSVIPNSTKVVFTSSVDIPISVATQKLNWAFQVDNFSENVEILEFDETTLSDFLPMNLFHLTEVTKAPLVSYIASLSKAVTPRGLLIPKTRSLWLDLTLSTSRLEQVLEAATLLSTENISTDVLNLSAVDKRKTLAMESSNILSERILDEYFLDAITLILILESSKNKFTKVQENLDLIHSAFKTYSSSEVIHLLKLNLETRIPDSDNGKTVLEKNIYSALLGSFFIVDEELKSIDIKTQLICDGIRKLVEYSNNQKQLNLFNDYCKKE